MKKGPQASKARRKDSLQRSAAAAKLALPEARTRPENGLDGLEFLTPCEAITWAAFGQAVEADDLMHVLAPELARWWSGPKTWLPRLFFFHDPFEFFDFSPNLILKSLEAHARSEAELSDEQSKHLAFYMRRREALGLSHLPRTSDHVEFLRQYLSQAADAEMKLMECKREFQKLISLGHIRLTGRPFDQRQRTDQFGVVWPSTLEAHAIREQISGEVFLPGISIDFEGYLTDVNGHILYEGLIADIDDVRRAYPVGQIEPIDPKFLQPTQSSNTSTKPSAGRAHAGGRPKGEATRAAQKELMRLAVLRKLPTERSKIREYLEHFFENHDLKAPAQSTLEDMISDALQTVRDTENSSEN
jgi:hypothetical protein